MLARHVVATHLSGVGDGHEQFLFRPKQQRLGESAVLARLIKIDLVDEFAGLIVDADRVCITVVGPEAGDIQPTVGAEGQALRPIKLAHPAFVGDEAAAELAVSGKAQDLPALLVLLLTVHRHIEKAVRAKHNAPGMKVTVRRHTPEAAQKCACCVVGQEPARRVAGAGHAARGIKHLFREGLTDDTERCKRSIFIRRRHPGTQEGARVAVVAQHRSWLFAVDILVRDHQLLPIHEHAPGSDQPAAF
ncbi:hypothetical protein D3C84_511240 [compost metagenome]